MLTDPVHAIHLIDLLHAEHQALAGIAAGDSLALALEQLLLALQGQSEEPMHACVLLIDEADRYYGAAAPTLPPDLTAALQAGDTQQSPFGMAGFSGAPVYCGDIARDPIWSAGRKEAVLHGYRSCWATPVFGAKGHVLGVLGLLFQTARHPTQAEIELMTVSARSTAHVIERSRLEQAVQHARDQARLASFDGESRFHALASALPLQSWLAQPDGTVYWLNEVLCDYTGLSMQSLLDGGLRLCIHPDEREQAEQAWQLALAEQAPFEMPLRLRAHDSQYRCFLARAVPLFDEGGTLVRWVGSNSDVQEQKNLQEEMGFLARALEQERSRRSSERDRMWRLSTDIMLMADLHGVIIAVNPAWTGVLARSESDSLGIEFISLVHPDDRPVAQQHLTRLVEQGVTVRMELRYRRHDGVYRWIAWRVMPAQKLVHAIGRDVTDEKEALLALQRSEQALLQAQKLESIGKLTGGVAHDFNNVLQIISGNLQLLKLSVGEHEQAARRLLSAESAVERGARLSSQLLAFARRQPLKPQVTDLGRLLRSMQELIRRALGEHIIEEVFISENLWHTLVDTNQMENVLLNMAINARDAMADLPGGGRLTFTLGNVTLDGAYASLHADVQPGQYVLLTITDTGHGMTQEVIGQIFEPFFTTKREGEGTGLGLAMAYGFIRQSAGHIEVHSAPGAGTTFKIYLPRSLEQLAELASEPAVVRPGPVRGGVETIMVVEDDVQVRHTVVDMLLGLGYTVLQAEHGEAALALLAQAGPVDLLLTDVVMPGAVPSTDLARLARLARPGLAVLFTSGHAHDVLMQGGRLAPCVELLSKPYGREQLARTVRRVLDERCLPDTSGPAGQHILLVEDNDDARGMSTEMLNMLGHTVISAADAEAALLLLDTPGLAVLVTDISLPGKSGLELADLARSRQPQLEVVFASGHAWGASLARERQATFLQKPFGLEQLARALNSPLPAPLGE